MRIAFPPEMTGNDETSVLCWGPIVRKELLPTGDNPHAIAASIFRYRFEQF